MIMVIVLIAPDSFKGSASAVEVARALGRGWASVRPDDELVAMPFADGGEGTLRAIETALPQARPHPIRVTGPVENPVHTRWLELPDGTALVELADASGMLRLPQNARGNPALAPLDAHTVGTGEVIRAAIDAGARRIAVAIGGSASTDAGVGILNALGVVVRDRDGAPVRPGARYLHDIAEVDSTALVDLPPGGIEVWSDVTNPLTGTRGAAAVYGPQKGSRRKTRYQYVGRRRAPRRIGLDS